MSKNDPAFRDHLAWLGYLQPDGLVVSPAAMVDSQIIIDRSEASLLQEQFSDYLVEIEDEDKETFLRIENIRDFLRGFLNWPEDCLYGKDCEQLLPDELTVALPELGQDLSPTWAFKNPKAGDDESPWLMLIKELEPGEDLDKRQSESSRSWNASAHQKLERLMRETQVPVGLLTNRDQIRLIYAPRGESTGHLTFPIEPMCEVQGRLIIGAFYQLLKGYTLVTAPSEARLLPLLKKSRDYQANVSTKLAEQVVEALYELLRGFQSANDQSNRDLLKEVLQKEPDNIYKGLLNTLLRLVFLLYAEDRGLMPTSELYVRNYSVHGLFARLRADNERYPDTMDHRYGAWSQLLALFRVVHRGSKNPMLQMPPRSGYLFDPEPCPFLEGQTLETPMVPLVPDGTVFRVLRNLLLLDGERLSYKTLDVEQIGSVYETIMGFEIKQATGRMISLKPKKRHGAPMHVDLDHLLEMKPADRVKALKEQADTKLPAATAKVFKAAATVDELLVSLEKRIDRRASPRPVPLGAIILQPTDERRRSGSHYTPRSFTEPIVRKTLDPIFQRLGEHPKPDAILDLKVADIAVGSAAFLVEACRQLADKLVDAWAYHDCMPVIPADEDELLYARRIVAQRSLYGVDRNPMAVDLAKLSLWLATMAKDHPFTFLDHSIKCGDSLVGLTNNQIGRFHWDNKVTVKSQLGQQHIDRDIKRVIDERVRILSEPGDDAYAIGKKMAFLDAAEQHSRPLRRAGDLAVAAFFLAAKKKASKENREDYLERLLCIQRGEELVDNIPWFNDTLNELESGEHPVRPFHWELEFPEVFAREKSGFDAIIGNPPFLGGKRISTANGTRYRDWLDATNSESSNNADLVAYFFRRAFLMLRKSGNLGLISTNSINQGDTRETGLRWIRTKGGGSIYEAIKRAKWPGEAAVIVSIIWICNNRTSSSAKLDGRVVQKITAFLFHAGSDESPNTLRSNDQKSFIGCFLRGMGFTFDDNGQKDSANSLSLLDDLIRADSRNRERIFPYIGGEEVNEHPKQSPDRFVINFENFPLRRIDCRPLWIDATDEQRFEYMSSGDVPMDYPEAVAADWPMLLDLVKDKVKSERDELGNSNIDKAHKRFWWRFANSRPELFSRLKEDSLFLVIARVSRTCAFSFLPVPVVPSDQLVVFPQASFATFAALQNSTHEIWARFFASSMKDDLRYNPSDCFETFPFPMNWEGDRNLEAIGKEYYEFRGKIMVINNVGLTKIYSQFHDPEETSSDIIRLRELHAKIDRTVLDAYGWSDVSTDCEFVLDYEEEDDNDSGKKRKKKKPWRYRWPDEVRDDVLARLLTLNQERYEEECAQGLHAKKKVKKKAARKRAKKSAAKISGTQTKLLPDQQGELFDM